MTLGTGKLKQEVSSWPGISAHPHRFAAQEYRFGKAEVGHVHFCGDVDIPFPRPVHDFLLGHNLAEQHRWVPDSGWTTFRIRGDKDIEHAIWLMRLSISVTGSSSKLIPFGFLRRRQTAFISAPVWSPFSRDSLRLGRLRRKT
jgi:hypothetical protein